MRGSITPRARLTAALVAAVVFVAYALGSCPTIYVGDSGELVTAVATLGIPHPSGYPLYVLLGKLWTLMLPFGSVAWRMSLFSAAAAASAIGGMYLLCRYLRMSPCAATFAALLAAFGPSFWAEATIQRVYALNAVFVVAATTLALVWQRNRSENTLAAAFAVCGVGASNHTFMAMMAIALGVFMLACEPHILARWSSLLRRTLLVFVPFVAGLLPYGYLVLRSRMDPPLDWGDPESFRSLIRVILRTEYWQNRWIEGPHDVLAVIADYGVSLGRESAWLGAGLALIGLPSARKLRCPIGFPLLVMATNLLIVASHGSFMDIFVWHRYYIPSYLMLALLAGIGCQAVLVKIPRSVGWGTLAVPLVLLVTGWQSQDRSRYRIAESYAEAVLDSIEPAGRLVAGDDNILFPLMYLHLVEGRRPDIDLLFKGVNDDPVETLDWSIVPRRLYFTHSPSAHPRNLSLAPVGLVFLASPVDAPPPSVSLKIDRLDGEDDPRVPKDELSRYLIGHFHFMRGLSLARTSWARARDEFVRAEAVAPDSALLFFYLGQTFAVRGLYEDAIAAFQRTHAIQSRRLSAIGRPLASDMVLNSRAGLERVLALEAVIERENPLLPPRATAQYHREMARLLSLRGEPVAARRHKLRAMEIEPAAP